jgi:alpha-tubulin suppressor-like RCC1 family protein
MVTATSVGFVVPLFSPEPALAGALAASISAGRDHTCAITAHHGAVCWGYNYYGDLGDGVRSDEVTPIGVSGLHSGVAAIGSGADNTCALTTKGGVKCWGDNGYGQDGAVTTSTPLSPINVTGLRTGVKGISVGFDHVCAVTDAGAAKCWGDNWAGALGDGTTNNSPTPVDVTGLASGVVAVSAGSNYSCALITGGGVKCWGDNGNGQLGDGTTSNSGVPVDVVGLGSGVAAVVASPMGFHTCALMITGGVKCWGSNNFGELGDATTNESHTPVDVSSLSSGVASLTLGQYHTCALTTRGGLRCWGLNQGGQLGDGSRKSSSKPVGVHGLASGVLSASAGNNYTCAVKSTGAARCWGRNHRGQLGDGTTHDRSRATQVAGLPGVPKLFWFSPSSGPAGTKVAIIGVDLQHATSVSFHYSSAHFTIVSNTKIVATVPAGAHSGLVRITTPGGKAVSLVQYMVT